VAGISQESILYSLRGRRIKTKGGATHLGRVPSCEVLGCQESSRGSSGRVNLAAHSRCRELLLGKSHRGGGISGVELHRHSHHPPETGDHTTGRSGDRVTQTSDEKLILTGTHEVPYFIKRPATEKEESRVTSEFYSPQETIFHPGILPLTNEQKRGHPPNFPSAIWEGGRSLLKERGRSMPERGGGS